MMPNRLTRYELYYGVDVPPDDAETVRDQPITVTLRIGTPSRSLPRLGLSLATPQTPTTEAHKTRLRELRLDHLRACLVLPSPDWQTQLLDAAAIAADTQARLDLSLALTDAATVFLPELQHLLASDVPMLARIAAFDRSDGSTPAGLLQTVRQRLDALQVPIGGGTMNASTDLEHHPPASDALDFVVYGLHPPATATRNADLMAALPQQAATVARARTMRGDVPIHIAPIGLRPQPTSPTKPPSSAAKGALPSDVDPRQMSLLGAAWLLGSISALAETDAAQLTYFETIGWRGVMAAVDGSPLPHHFPHIPDAVYPMWHILRAIADYRDGLVIPMTNDAPQHVQALALRRSFRQRVLVTNGTSQRLTVAVHNLEPVVIVKSLDATTVADAMQRPYAWTQTGGKPLRAAGDVHTFTLEPHTLMQLDSLVDDGRPLQRETVMLSELADSDDGNASPD